MSELDAERFERGLNATLTDDDLEIINVEYTKGSLSVALAAGVKAERARIVALLEAARDDARANFNSDRVDGLVQSANEEAAGAAMCNYLLNKVRR